MRPPAPPLRLVAVAPTNSELDGLVTAAGGGVGGHVERLDDIRALDRGRGDTVDAVVFTLDRDAANPMAMLRDVHARAPFAQIVFIGADGAIARARQKLLLVGGLTEQWTFLAADQPATWPVALREAGERAERRRQLKSAIAPLPGGPQSAASPSPEAAMPHLAGVLTHMQEAVLFLDLRGAITYANPAAERLYGRGADALRGRPVGTLAGPAPDAMLAEVLAGGPGGSIMIEQPVGDGQPRAIEVSMSPVKDWRGQLAGVTWIARDVTERLAAERAAVAEARAQALQALNEELTAQTEELEAQQAELGSLYEQLKQQNQRIEVQVAERTAELAARTEALQSSEKRLLQAQALTHVGHWEWDLQTERITWSDELYRIFGLSPDSGDITIERFRETLHPDDFDRAMGVVGQAIEQGGPFGYEARFVRPDGTVRVVDTKGEALPGEDGRTRLLLGACLDVTDRQAQSDAIARHNEELQAVNEELAAQAEELAEQQDELQRSNRALASQSKLLASVLEHVPGGVGYADRDLVVRMVNSQFAANYQRRAEDFLGKTFTEAFPESQFPGLAARAEAPLRHVLATREPWRSVSYPVSIKTPDGHTEERFRDAVVVPVLDEDGAIEGLLSLSFDVTDRVRAEREAARSAQALAAQVALTDRIIQHAPVVMAYVDRNLVYRWNNSVHSQLVGKPPSEVVGHGMADVLPPETYATTAPLYQRVLASGEPFHTRSFPTRMHGHDDTVYLDMSYVPILDDTGEAQGLLIIAVDVTDRAERERLQASTIEALKQADRTKDEFLSVISHELRTPLNFIMGFASTLEDEVQGPLNPLQREAIGKIMSGADRMVLLVDDLLDFARMQAGTFHLDEAPTPFTPLVDEVVATMRPLAAQKGLTIDTDVQGDFTPTLDGHRIVQVLTNLVSNAIKFTDHGHVSVRVRSRDGELLTEVVDTGSGIAPQDIPRLFQRFQQLDMSQTRRVGGTGLGLAISKAIVEAHRGTIGVESEPGTGSTFWFALPL